MSRRTKLLGLAGLSVAALGVIAPAAAAIPTPAATTAPPTSGLVVLLDDGFALLREIKAALTPPPTEYEQNLQELEAHFVLAADAVRADAARTPNLSSFSSDPDSKGYTSSDGYSAATAARDLCEQANPQPASHLCQIADQFSADRNPSISDLTVQNLILSDGETVRAALVAFAFAHDDGRANCIPDQALVDAGIIPNLAAADGWLDHDANPSVSCSAQRTGVADNGWPAVAGPVHPAKGSQLAEVISTLENLRAQDASPWECTPDTWLNAHGGADAVRSYDGNNYPNGWSLSASANRMPVACSQTGSHQPAPITPADADARWATIKQQVTAAGGPDAQAQAVMHERTCQLVQVNLQPQPGCPPPPPGLSLG
jgi:hypothetical protein